MGTELVGGEGEYQVNRGRDEIAGEKEDTVFDRTRKE